MTLQDSIGPWSGVAFRHVPAASPYELLDFRFAGLAANNRWNERGEPTLYLASDLAVALAEFARHLTADRSERHRTLAHARAVYSLELAVEAALDLRDPPTQQALSLSNPTDLFLDRRAARAVATFIRRTTRAQALLVPSVAFLDDLSRWVLVLFLEKLPADPSRFIRSVHFEGTFHVGT